MGRNLTKTIYWKLSGTKNSIKISNTRYGITMDQFFFYVLILYLYGNKLTVPFSISRRISNHRAVVILIFRKIRQVDCEFYVGINIHFRLFFHSSYFIRVNYVGENPLYELMVSTVTYRDLFSI